MSTTEEQLETEQATLSLIETIEVSPSYAPGLNTHKILAEHLAATPLLSSAEPQLTLH